MITEEVRKFVEEECRKPESKYGYEIYITHFVPTTENAKKLAENQNADIEIVELASWLHDIGSIINGRKDHHITGAKIAEKKLRELNYPQERIEKVKHCILAHRGSHTMKRKTPEAQIIADADGMAVFDRIEGLFKAAFTNENLGQIEARKSVKEKLINSYNKLSPKAKEIIKPKFDAATLLLS